MLFVVFDERDKSTFVPCPGSGAQKICYPRNKMKHVFSLLVACASMLVFATNASAAPMPNPNGYEYFIRAGDAFVPDNKGVDEVTSTKYEKGKIYPIAPKEAWLKRNAKAFHLLREGLKYPVWQPKVQFSHLYPNYSKFRWLARALRVESHVYAERGELDKAVGSAVDIIDFGYAIPRGGPLIASLVGNAITAMGFRELENLLPRLDASTSRTASFRLGKIYANRFPYYKTVQGDKMYGQELLKDALKRTDWRKQIADAGDLSVIQAARLLSMSKEELMADYSRLMDAQIDNAHLPYSTMQPVTGFKKSPVAIFAINVSSRRWIQARADTQCVLAMTMLALRAYKMNHGNYPRTLQKLVPHYLRKVPLDSFDGLTPLRYRLEGEKYFLWSIGPDGINNNGRPIENKNRPERGRYRSWNSGATGDIVAGLNML